MASINKAIPGSADYDIWMYKTKDDPYGSRVDWLDVPEDIQEQMLQYTHIEGTHRFIRHEDQSDWWIEIYEQ
jgi:hypothetical protein